MNLVREFSHLLAVATLILLPAAAWGADRNRAGIAKSSPGVGLFEALKSGDIEVKLIPKDSTTGTVIITNRTQRPLTIKLPVAFAGVPVAAQFGGAGGGLGGGGNNSNNAANQGVGGGFGGGGGGLGGGGGGGGLFNVAPERAVKLKFVAVCLEHGKKDPHPRVNYDLQPIESFTSDAKVIALVQMLGRGELDQTAAQAAAWRLTNGLSWPELAAKIGVKHLDGTTQPYFTSAELERAFRASTEACRRAEGAHRTATTTAVSAQTVE